MAPSAAVHLEDDGARCYGTSWTHVRRMIENDRVRAWTFTPILGGCLFSMATILLRRNTRAMLAAQAVVGVGTLGMGNGVATSAIVKERSHT